MMPQLVSRIVNRLKRRRVRNWTTIVEFARSNPRRWHRAYPAQPSGYAPPVCFGPTRVDFDDTLSDSFPELGVVELTSGRVDCRAGWVFDANNTLLPECSWFGMDVEKINLPRPELPPRDIPGVALTLLSNWSERNYGHLLLDSLSRLHLFEKAGLNLRDCDHVVCPGNPNSKAAQLVQELGIPFSKCLWSAENGKLAFDTLFATSFPGVRRNYPPWLAQFLRERLGTPARPSHRRLFVVRSGGRRNVSNEAELRAGLRDLGFEIYDPIEHPKSRADFAEAQFVVGAHGAGLTDIVFCPPGAALLELMPSDHMLPYYCTLAQAALLKYGCVLGLSAGRRRKKSWGPSPFDFSVDVEVVRAAIATMSA
jgi:hypothetical protein